MDKRKKFLIGGCGMIIAGIISLGIAALMNAELQKIQMQFSRPEVQLGMLFQGGGKMSDTLQQGMQTGYNRMTAAIIIGLLLTASGGILIAVRPAPRSETSVSPPTIAREQAKDTETLPLVTAICPKCGKTNTGTTALYHCQHCGQNLHKNN